jgi:hypothetical protein
MMPSASLLSLASRQRLACVIACGALAGYYVLSATEEPSIASGRRPAHEYSTYDPEWTQLVFPHLGTPAAPATSPTGALTYLTGRLPFLEQWRLATFAQVAALALFGATLLRLGLPAAVAAFAIVGVGLHPAMMQAATVWTPYLLLPLLLMGVVIACLQYGASRDRRYAILLAVLATLAIAESLYAALLLVPVLAWRDGPARDRAIPQSARMAGVTGVLAIGLALQIIGAAVVWRVLAAPTLGGLPSWRDAFVAITTRWGRLVAIYAAPSIDHTRAVISMALTDVSPFVLIFALVGIVSIIRARSLRGRWVVPLVIASFTVVGTLVSPLSSVSSAEIPLAALIFLLAAFGLALLTKVVPWAISSVIFFGAVAATHAVAAPRLSPADARQEVSIASALADLPPASAIVVSNVDIDRRIDEFYRRHPSTSRVSRIPFASNWIRQAIGPDVHVFAWEAFRTRVEALGFMLAPATMARTSLPSEWGLYEVVDAMPCEQLRDDEWNDVTTAAHAGALSLQTSSAGGYAVEFDAGGVLPGELQAYDGLTGARVDLLQQGSDRYRVDVSRGRRSLPVVSFNDPPARVRARFATSYSGAVVRVCGVPLRGTVVRLPASGAFTSLRLGDQSALTTGWHQVESGPDGRLFRWSSARTAIVRVQLPGPPATAQIEVDAMPALPPSRSPVLSMQVNDRILGSREMTPGPATYTWTVPADTLRRGLNVFRLSVPEVTSPLATGFSSDAREMGMALVGFRIRRVG